MPTNYAPEPDTWNDTHAESGAIEKPCPHCRGRYPQIDSCITCEGNGTVLT
ncbi:hypothetical protein GCM10010331_45640 [Streptomyces xanthochromogenes]|nr:hypothetical protein GCM10010331_45640 [Streptomyces xanthochromogenes]